MKRLAISIIRNDDAYVTLIRKPLCIASSVPKAPPPIFFRVGIGGSRGGSGGDALITHPHLFVRPTKELLLPIGTTLSSNLVNMNH